MGDLEWLVKMLTQGGAVSAIVGVVGLILLKYVPALIKEFKETVQGIVTNHAETIKEERELFRGEMKELRTTFASGLKEMNDTSLERNAALTGRLDTLTESHRDLREEVHGLQDKLGR